MTDDRYHGTVPLDPDFDPEDGLEPEDGIEVVDLDHPDQGRTEQHD